MDGEPLYSLPANTVRRLFKVIVRAVHLVGIAGVFGAAMTHTTADVYFALAILSGLVLVVLDSVSGWGWIVQLRGVALLVKLMLLIHLHLYPERAVPSLIAVIALSGFMAHAPCWIRYFSLLEWKVVHSKKDVLG